MKRRTPDNRPVIWLNITATLIGQGRMFSGVGETIEAATRSLREDMHRQIRQSRAALDEADAQLRDMGWLPRSGEQT